MERRSVWGDWAWRTEVGSIELLVHPRQHVSKDHAKESPSSENVGMKSFVYTHAAAPLLYLQPVPSPSPRPSQSHLSPRRTNSRHHSRSISCDSSLCADGCAMRSQWCCCGLLGGLRRGGAGVGRGPRRALGRGEKNWGGWLDRKDRSEWGRCRLS